MASPTHHELLAALRVARIVDDAGNFVTDVRDSYRHVLSQGEHRAADLHVGEVLLLAAGVLVRTGDHILPGTTLTAIANLDDDTALRIISNLLTDTVGPAGDDVDRRAEVGAAGEDQVLIACKEELGQLGRPDLASAVQRVSLVDDSLGYDVSAPRISGPPRMLEVKTSGGQAQGMFAFYLTRNEYDVGRKHPRSWALVACALTGRQELAAGIIGWCRVSSLEQYLPNDGNGHWTEALVRLPPAILIGGIPSAV